MWSFDSGFADHRVLYVVRLTVLLGTGRAWVLLLSRQSSVCVLRLCSALWQRAPRQIDLR